MSVRTQNGHGRTDISVYCTYKLKWKPLFAGKARLDIQSHYKGELPGMPLCPSVPKIKPILRLGSLCTKRIRSINLGMDKQSEWLLFTLSIPHI